MRLQEKRMREMTVLERFEYEGKIQDGIIEEMKACYRRSTDPVNKEFMAWFIQKAINVRETRKAEVIETFMHCEASEGVAS